MNRSILILIIVVGIFTIPGFTPVLRAADLQTIPEGQLIKLQIDSPEGKKYDGEITMIDETRITIMSLSDISKMRNMAGRLHIIQVIINSDDDRNTLHRFHVGDKVRVESKELILLP